MPTRDAAILAYALVYGATGADLFADLWVRVRGAVLTVNDNGLSDNDNWNDDNANDSRYES